VGDLIFPAGTKLAWIEAVAKDRRASPFHVRLCVAIASQVDRYTGVARVSQFRLASIIGATERGVRKGIDQIEGLGHLQVEKPAHGVGSDGRTAFGGRAGTATYRPIQTRNHGSGLSQTKTGETRNHGTGNSEALNPEHGSRKPGTVVPPLPYKTPIKNPGACVRARESGGDKSELQCRWQAVKDKLAELLDRDVVVAWLDHLQATELSNGVVTMAAPTKFLRQEVEDRFGLHIANAWRKADASIKSVRFILQAARPAEVETPHVADEDRVAEKGSRS
jgi:hypothetical protein